MDEGLKWIVGLVVFWLFLALVIALACQSPGERRQARARRGSGGFGAFGGGADGGGGGGDG